MGKIVAAYARVSTERQAERQSIEQQLTALRAYAVAQGWTLADEQIDRDEGWSGARLDRPARDRLRDAAGRALVDTVLIASPDRLARRYAYQVWLLEEFARAGCDVIFLDRPSRDDPQDALLVQIRGAVAEYERTVIADRTRRGRLAALQAGRLVPWSRPPYGYRADPQAPRDPAGLARDEAQAAVVCQIFTWYVEDGLPLKAIARRLTATGTVGAHGARYHGRRPPHGPGAPPDGCGVPHPGGGRLCHAGYPRPRGHRDGGGDRCGPRRPHLHPPGDRRQDLRFPGERQ